MTISSKQFHLKSILACAALALVFTTAQPNSAMAMVAAVSEDTPGTVTTPDKGPVHKNSTYKSNVAKQIAEAIAAEKAKAQQKQQLSDMKARAQIDSVNRMLDDAKKSGMTDADIRKELSVLRPSPVTPLPATTTAGSTAQTPTDPALTRQQKLLMEMAKHKGWSEETLRQELSSLNNQGAGTGGQVPALSPSSVSPTVSPSAAYNPNTIVSKLQKEAANNGWSEEFYNTQLKAAMDRYYSKTQ